MIKTATTPTKRSSVEQRLRALSIVFVSIPFAFALIRAVRTGYDLRYLWVACASLLGAVMVMTVGKTSSKTRQGVVALSTGAFFVATLFGVLMAWVLGTEIGVGSLLVASAFGFCCAVSRLFHTLARAQVF